MTAPLTADYLFESSWEVCNRVGGIYTVLSTHAKEMTLAYQDRLCFIGPDIKTVYSPSLREKLFSEEATSLDDWREVAHSCDGLNIRTGRWNIPGRPLAVLVDFRPYYADENRIYGDFWNWYGVDSLHGNGDYPEACMFAYACGEVIASRYRYLKSHSEAPIQAVAHFHEWTTGLGLLYCKHHLPEVATVFTTHATSIGRSICGNGKLLYAYMDGYHGDQMADELSMQSKHSLEKAAAREADCFTTVSGITSRECEQLLERKPDIVTPNGFEDGFVLSSVKAARMRVLSRRKLLDVASSVLGYMVPADSLLIATAGRYEFRNKGLDVFIESLHHLSQDDRLQRTVIAYILVPGDVSAPRQEVFDNLNRIDNVREWPSESLPSLHSVYHPYNTHWLNHIEDDRILNSIKYWGFGNRSEEKVKVIFVPCYLHGYDGIFNMAYYDLLQGFDLTAFLSYYEPWGYTPLESIAFSVPTLTTSLSGFGAWYLESGHARNTIDGGVAVIERNDGNYAEVVKEASETMLRFSSLSEDDRKVLARNARKVSKKALWHEFIKYYKEAYRLASVQASLRRQNDSKK